MLRRAGLIGDVHCEVNKLRRVLELFQASHVDAVLQVGDICDGPGDLTEAVRLLEGAGAIAVAGNHDRWLLAGEMRDLPDATPIASVTPEVRKYLAGLHKMRTLATPRGNVMVCHGLGEDDMASVRPDDEGYALLSNEPLWCLIKSRKARFVVNGHSHRPMLRTIDGLTIMNAGALHPIHRPVCSIADFDTGQMQVYDVTDSGVTHAEKWSFERGSRPMQTMFG